MTINFNVLSAIYRPQIKNVCSFLYIPSQLFNPDIKKKFIPGHVHLKDLKTSGGWGIF